MADIEVIVQRYTSRVPGGLTADVDILKLSTVVDGVVYSHRAALPPPEYLLRFPDSAEDTLRGAKEALLAKVQQGQEVRVAQR